MHNTTEITVLALDEIVPNPDQPRKRFERQPLAELAASISSVGLLEPIIVRPVDGHYVIVAGERRWRAAAMAGLTSIAAIVVDVDEASAFELSMIENVVRADMNAIEEAAGYQTLVDGGMTVETIATRLGKTAQDVRFRLNLLRLDAPIAELVATGQLGTWDAWHIARLSVEGQHRVIRAMRNGELTKVGSVRHLALAIFEQESQVTAFGEAEAPALPARTVESTRDLRDECARIVKAIGQAENLVACGEAELTDEIRLLVAEARKRATRLDTLLATASARQMAASL